MDLASGKHIKNYGKSPFLKGKSTWILIGWTIWDLYQTQASHPKLLHMCNSPLMVNHWDGTHYWLVVSNIGLVWGFMMVNDG